MVGPLGQKAEGMEDWQTLSKASKKRSTAKVASTTKEVLDQGNEHPKAELAKSGRSKCLVCREKIESGTLRIGVLRMIETPRFSKKSTSWLHPTCWNDCEELSTIDDLDQALRGHSPEVWTTNLFPLSGLVSKADWPKFTSWLEEQEEECSHDEESYLNWFEKGTGAQAKAARLYAVMGDVAGTGACACAASAGTFEYPAVEAK